MKHMFTNAPVAVISMLPEPLGTAVQDSRMWKWERSQGMPTTGCIASVFPKDEKQDASFTFWCDHIDGYELNQVFGLQIALSKL